MKICKVIINFEKNNELYSYKLHVEKEVSNYVTCANFSCMLAFSTHYK